MQQALVPGLGRNGSLLLDQAQDRRISHAAGSDVRLPSCAIARVKSGWFGQYQGLIDGRKQFVALFVPGDLIAIETLFLGSAGFQISALTSGTLAVYDHALLKELRQEPAITEFLFRELAVALRIQKQWAVRLSRLSAMERLAHLLCELHERLHASTRLNYLPLKQRDLADLVGLTAIHVNRVLRSLRDRRIVEVSNKGIYVIDHSRLRQVGMFDADYLRFDQEDEHVPPAMTSWSRNES